MPPVGLGMPRVRPHLTFPYLNAANLLVVASAMNRVVKEYFPIFVIIRRSNVEYDVSNLGWYRGWRRRRGNLGSNRQLSSVWIVWQTKRKDQFHVVLVKLN